MTSDEALEEWWDAEYAEYWDATHDTVDGKAQGALNTIKVRVRELILAERDRCAATCEEFRQALTEIAKGSYPWDPDPAWVARAALGRNARLK